MMAHGESTDLYHPSYSEEASESFLRWRKTARRRKDELHEIRELHFQLRTEILNRLSDFRQVRTKDYFYELCYCLLTPQSSAIQCEAVVRELKRRRFQKRELDPEPLLRSFNGGYVRFHKTKARRLVELKQRFPTVLETVRKEADAQALREFLVRHVKGISYKEASHFLRNIGRPGIAILDRHIIRNLVRLGLLSEWPASITRRTYLAIEGLFMLFARHLGIPAEELDLLFWKRETGIILK